MRSRPLRDEDQFIPLDTIDEQPIRLNVALAKFFLIACQLMIPILRRQHMFFCQMKDVCDVL